MCPSVQACGGILYGLDRPELGGRGSSA